MRPGGGLRRQRPPGGTLLPGLATWAPPGRVVAEAQKRQNVDTVVLSFMTALWSPPALKGGDPPRHLWGGGVTGGDPGAGAHGLLHLQTRRSMVFAKHLRAVGDEFRSRYLNSTDAADRIPFEEDWTKMKVDPTSVILGGGDAFCLSMPHS